MCSSDLIPVAEGEVVPDGRSGVLLSPEKAGRAARYVVRYNELRQLYEIDLRTWGRERTIYERHLEASEAETERQRKAAERSWFEKHAPEFAVSIGLVVGSAVTLGILAAVQEVDQ